MSSRFSGLLVASLLLITSCQTSSHSAPGDSTFPDTASVGPIPGDVNMLHTTVDPFLKDAAALQEGKRLFGWYNCAGCHGIHGGGGMGPSLRDAVWIYGNRDDQIMDTLIHGRSNGMPAWGSKIPENQMWKLVAYIKSLNTPMEPDAPVTPAEEQIPSSDIYPPSDRSAQPR